MARSKYDTNPLDHKVKESADENLGNGSAQASSSDTRALQPAGIAGEAGDRTTPGTYAAAGVEQPTIAFQTQPRAQPTSRGGMPYPEPPFQSGRPQNMWPPAVSPQPLVAARGQIRKGLDIDANVEAGLSYFPLFGAIMAILVLAKEPKENRFARFHAMQALILHGLTLFSRAVLAMFTQVVLSIGAGFLGGFTSNVGSLIDLIAFGGLLYLGYAAFKMRMPNLPWVAKLAEKYLRAL